MEHISLYLKKFQKIGLDNVAAKKIVIDTVSEIAKVDLSKEDFEIKNGVVNINKSGSEKAQIFLYKDAISEVVNQKISNQFGVKSAKKIR